MDVCLRRSIWATVPSVAMNTLKVHQKKFPTPPSGFLRFLPSVLLAVIVLLLLSCLPDLNFQDHLMFRYKFEDFFCKNIMCHVCMESKNIKLALLILNKFLTVHILYYLCTTSFLASYTFCVLSCPPLTEMVSNLLLLLVLKIRVEKISKRRLECNSWAEPRDKLL